MIMFSIKQMIMILWSYFDPVFLMPCIHFPTFQFCLGSSSIPTGKIQERFGPTSLSLLKVLAFNCLGNSHFSCIVTDHKIVLQNNINILSRS